MSATLFKLFAEAKRYSRSGAHKTIPLFFLLTRLYFKSKFSKKGKPVSERIGQFTFHAYDYPSLINMYREIFLKEVYRADEIISTNPFIVDCGSNIGVSVLYFKMQYPNSEVWAFEPNPSSYAMLQKNVEANRLSNVRLFNCALTNQKGMIRFFKPKDDASINGSIVDGYSESIAIDVEAARLSDLVIARKIDLIKIDIEGSEQLVISDLKENGVLKNTSVLAIEYHKQLGETSSSVEAFTGHFRNLGFKHTIRDVDEARNYLIHFYRI